MIRSTLFTLVNTTTGHVRRCTSTKQRRSHTWCPASATDVVEKRRSAVGREGRSPVGTPSPGSGTASENGTAQRPAGGGIWGQVDPLHFGFDLLFLPPLYFLQKNPHFIYPSVVPADRLFAALAASPGSRR